MIQNSVGRGGRNNSSDVRVVQQLLNKFDMPGAQKLTVDGTAGVRTLAAIEAFQRMIRMSRPDGCVEPGGVTISALLQGSGTAKAPLGKSNLINSIAVSSADESQVSFSNDLDHVSRDVVSQYTISIIKKALSMAGVKHGVITSTIRTPQKQANILYQNNVVGTGAVRYREPGNKIINDAKERKKKGETKESNVKKMIEEIERYAQHGQRVSMHCVPLYAYRVLNVVDLGVNSTRAKNSSLNSAALTKAFRDLERQGLIRKFIDETSLSNHAWHIEVPQNSQA